MSFLHTEIYTFILCSKNTILITSYYLNKWKRTFILQICTKKYSSMINISFNQQIAQIFIFLFQVNTKHHSNSSHIKLWHNYIKLLISKHTIPNICFHRQHCTRYENLTFSFEDNDTTCCRLFFWSNFLHHWHPSITKYHYVNSVSSTTYFSKWLSTSA